MSAGKSRSAYAVVYACDPANVAKARSIIVRNVKIMQEKPVDAQELELAKAMMLREIPLGESSIGSIALGYIHRIVFNLPLDEPTRAAQRYAGLTAEQVRAAFAKWLRPKDWVQVTEGPSPR